MAPRRRGSPGVRASRSAVSTALGSHTPVGQPNGHSVDGQRPAVTEGSRLVAYLVVVQVLAEP
jgi:hypothetical protein